MPWPRAAIAVAVIGLVLLGAGWALASAGSAGPLHAPARRGLAPAANAALMQQLRHYLAQSSRPQRRVRPQALTAPTPAVPSAPGSACFVAGGACSIHACVVPVASTPRPACAAAQAPVRAVPVSRP